MRAQYSDSPIVVAVDSASPVTSLAIGLDASAVEGDTGARLLGSRQTPSGRSSTDLLALLDDLLREHRVPVGSIVRLIGSRGPGSFTGLRIGMATLLGLADSVDARATAVTAFEALAAQAGDADRPTVTVVDALRGEWFAQVFAPEGGPQTEPEIVSPQRLDKWAPCRVIGFGLAALETELSGRGEFEILEASPLAPTLLELAALPGLAWDPSLLTRPLYLRPPATTNARR